MIRFPEGLSQKRQTLVQEGMGLERVDQGVKACLHGFQDCVLRIRGQEVGSGESTPQGSKLSLLG